MTDASFEKLDPSEQPLYGPRRLVLCGFDTAARADFEKLMKVAEVGGLDCHWAGDSDGELLLKTLFEAPLGPPGVPAGDHPRTIVAGGLLQKELHLLMNLSREVGMPPTLWAVLTPTSAKWPLKALLKELNAERAARKRQPPK